MVHIVVVVVAGDQAEGKPRSIQDVNRFGGVQPFVVLGFCAIIGRIGGIRAVDYASIAFLDHVANVRNKPQFQIRPVIGQILSLSHKDVHILRL
jgi:hypothetical protein